MYITEAELRDQVRTPTTGASVVVPAGSRFSPSATDFIKTWKLVVREDDTDQGAPRRSSSDWNTPAHFPVATAGDVPRCTQCGETVGRKPSSLTQLNAQHYVHKSHPRIRLRGQLDSLHALLLMAQHHARTAQAPIIENHLGTLAAYCRELTSAEYNERAAADLVLGAITADEIHATTHDPASTLGIGHLTIDGAAPELQHWLNIARTTSREVEITAAGIWGSPHEVSGASICHGLNRLSSALYFLQLLVSSTGSR